MRWLAELRNRGLPAQAAVLTATVLAVAAVVVPLAAIAAGTMGALAALVAGGLCLVGALAALAVCRVFRAPDQVWIGVLAGMLPRMGIPLGGAAALDFAGGPLAEAGLLYYLVIFYPLTLPARQPAPPHSDSSDPTS